MAWQNPKTDWRGTDGVRDSDLNRIEGNIEYLYAVSPARNAMTVYVNTTGNDTTGNGSTAAPFRTINKALSVIPRDLNGNDVAINIAAGTYDEDVIIKGFSGGALTLTGAYNARVSVNNFEVDGCICSLETIYLLLYASEVTVTNGAVLTGTGSLSVGNAPTSLVVNGCSRVCLANLISEGARNYAVSVDTASHVYIGVLSGEGNSEGILVQGGSIVATYNNTLDVMGEMVLSYTGGRYYTGSQNFAVNTLVDTEVVS